MISMTAVTISNRFVHNSFCIGGACQIVYPGHRILSRTFNCKEMIHDIHLAVF